mmetsp:Transcript_7855/g.11864  ORF Transcript_7855/g.11864 Transcript_7855/m.11864 type:complete len:149 (-) Transcript_7855:200-646(-)
MRLQAKDSFLIIQDHYNSEPEANIDQKTTSDESVTNPLESPSKDPESSDEDNAKATQFETLRLDISQQEAEAPCLLRTVSKYKIEKRPSRRFSRSRRKVLTFADDHGANIHETCFTPTLYYSHLGVKRRSIGCLTYETHSSSNCCTIS